MIRGKPHWFRKKSFGWGLSPITWQGWLYTFFWGFFISGPFTYFIKNKWYLSAGIWFFASVGYLLYDALCIISQINNENLD